VYCRPSSSSAMDIFKPLLHLVDRAPVYKSLMVFVMFCCSICVDNLIKVYGGNFYWIDALWVLIIILGSFGYTKPECIEHFIKNTSANRRIMRN
jgi:hypothetical protein